MTEQIMTGTCEKCGAEFSYYLRRNHKRRFCQECRSRTSKEDYVRRKKAEREMYKTAHAMEPTSNAKIMAADRKPEGCSDVRWRMELRRRANASFYSQCGAPADTLH